MTYFWFSAESASDSCGAHVCPAAGRWWLGSGSGRVLLGGSGRCCPRGCSCCCCRWRPWTPTFSRDSLEASPPPWSLPPARTPGCRGSTPAWTVETGCLSPLRDPGLGAGCSPSLSPRWSPVLGPTCRTGSGVWLETNSWWSGYLLRTVPTIGKWTVIPQNEDKNLKLQGLID